MPFIPDDDTTQVAVSAHARRKSGKQPAYIPPAGLTRQVDPNFLGQGVAWQPGTGEVQHIARDAADAIPAFMSMLPSFLAPETGGLSSIALSGLFSAGGEALRQHLLRVPGVAAYLGEQPPASATEAAGRMGVQGVAGGVSQAVPVVANSIGRGFLTSALHPESQMQLETAIRSRVPVGPGAFPWSNTGAEQIAKGLDAPAAKLSEYLARADNANMSPGTPLTISRDDVLAGLRSLYNKTRGVVTAREKAGAIRDVLDELESSYPREMKPSQVQKLKSDMQELLAAQYQKAGSQSFTALTPLDQAMNQARDKVASGARKALEGIGGGAKGSIGWNIKQANTQMAPLLDLSPSVAWEEAGPVQAASPGSVEAPNVQRLRGRAPTPMELNFSRGIDIPMMLAGNNPAIASRVGLGLTHPATQFLGGLAPRIAQAWLDTQINQGHAPKFLHLPAFGAPAATPAPSDATATPNNFIPDDETQQ